ncbi:perlucin-like protein [Mya arenaria]|uniref:perlucin-like protein n=1 Tax=Mya arenaria TaxID=6604 RepID=UPI0022E179C1|nr:perlucin-like protein [Mya arenaria]
MSEKSWKVYVNKDAGCEEGWHSYKNSSYFYSTEDLTWYDARDSSLEMGATLAVITDEAEDDFVGDLIGGSYYTWLGATDEDLEGSWRWVTGAELKFSPWFNVLDDNTRNCLIRRSVFGWIHATCDFTTSYLCEGVNSCA